MRLGGTLGRLDTLPMILRPKAVLGWAGQRAHVRLLSHEQSLGKPNFPASMTHRDSTMADRLKSSKYPKSPPIEQLSPQSRGERSHIDGIAQGTTLCRRKAKPEMHLAGYCFAPDDGFSAPRRRMTKRLPLGPRKESSRSPESSSSPRNSPK